MIGIGQHPSRGIRRGVVANVEATVEAIKRMWKAEQVAGSRWTPSTRPIGGGHVRGINSQGVWRSRAAPGKSPPSTSRAVEAARAVGLPDREILNVLTQGFTVDDQDGIREPIGMLGSRLGVSVHLVTGAATAVQNVVRSVNRAGLTVEDVVPAARLGESVLTPDERELGVS